MKRKILLFVIVVLSFITLVGCGNGTKNDEEIIKLESFHTQDQALYLAGDYKLFATYAKGQAELSRPNATILSWDKVEGVTSYVVKITDTDSKQDIEFRTDTNSLNVYNLKINTKYYYEITYESTTGSQSIEKKAFIIEDVCPRNLFIDGVTNVRDIGGYKTSSGKYVKQGLMYRSGRFSENETGEPLVTINGCKSFVNDLGLKTEIDLRRTDNNETGNITSSPLGDGVKYTSIPMATGGNYLKINKENIPYVFKELANKDNYPLVFHCSIGTDRTGVIAFLVNGFLGVSEEDLYRDYLFSNFGLIEEMRTPSTIKGYLQEIKMQDGGSLEKQFTNYLLSLGISQTELNTIRSIMLG